MPEKLHLYEERLAYLPGRLRYKHGISLRAGGCYRIVYDLLPRLGLVSCEVDDLRRCSVTHRRRQI